MSLLHRLLLLVFLALIPAAVIEIDNEVQLRTAREDEVRQTILRFAQLFAAEQERMMLGVRQLLFTIAQTPVVRDGSPADCQEFLERLRPGIPPYLRVRIAGPERITRCTTDPEGAGQPLHGQPEVESALDGAGFAIGSVAAPSTEPLPREAVALPVALPIQEVGGGIVGTAGALIDFGWVTHALASRPLPEGYALTIFDRNGVVLARVPDRPGTVGHRLPTSGYEPLEGLRAPAVMELPGLDRQPRLVGAVPLGEGMDGMLVAVSVERGAVLVPIERAMVRALSVIGVVMLLTLLASWWGADRFLRRPAYALIEAARRWSEGDLSARTGLADGRSEIGMLGRAFDSMAEALQAQAQAQAAANAMAHKAASVLSSTTDGVFEIDRSWRITFMNDRARALIGGRENLTGRRMRDAFADSTNSVFATHFQRAIAGTETVAFEAFYPPRQAWYAVRAFPSEDGLAVFFQDVTDLRRAEAARRHSEARFRAVFELAAVGIERLDRDGRYLDVNATLCAILGYRREELLEMTYADLTDPADLAMEEVLLTHLMAGVIPSYAIEKRCIRRDGQPVWVRVTSSLSPDADLEEAYRISIVEDISERKVIEGELTAAKEEAERANLAKSKFLAASSHDLRQPLQSLFFFSAALADFVPDGKGRDLLRRLDQGLDSMKGLLDSLLDVSRLDSGAITPTLEDFPVAAVIDAIDAAYAPLATGKGLEWRLESCDATVRSDRTLLARLVRNLVDNALRYTQSGMIRLRCKEEGGRLAIEVQDTGIGIPGDHLERIFEEFHQVGNPERDRALGLGLGLAIVRRLSLLLDHPVEVRSVHGRGSAFRVLVPLGEAQPAAAEAPATAPDGRGRFAVLVDDDAVVLLGLRTVLTEWGYTVLAAGSADQAMERLAAQDRSPDILIADYRLREGRVGTEVVRRVRERYGAGVPAMILTGETGTDSLRDAAAHGVPVIHKPVTPRQLWSEVERLLGASEGREGRRPKPIKIGKR
ncbi:PAS domain S-box protein [Azospirillum doebereinerae]|uniref:histidine kinase n=1 Tax=Azospirillum doebereinerae TaxID=92933 RepID=A0A3S0V3L9_9PROT|nr:PAS domain S-box protein [Azospirillum doebereinerae]RUQ63964.1 PAS domain S-box protein [Azospirillum doebereinerae]